MMFVRSERHPNFVLTLLALALPSAAIAVGPVSITEVYYNPPPSQGDLYEFVEIRNISASTVDLGGWRLRGDVDYSFPPGASLAPGAFGLICRDSEALVAHFGGTVESIIGNYDGVLDNGGGRLELHDGLGAFVDAVRWDDALPWGVEADGDFASLQRRCDSASGRDPLNWVAATPTPAAANPFAGCPPPAYQPPPVVISEILYHPADGTEEHPSTQDGEDEEFVELANRSASPVDIGGWRLADGVRYTFPAGTVLAPGAYLAVCRNKARIVAKYGVNEVVGDFEGRLANNGERIALEDASGRWVDSVVYGDNGEWPYAADGYGRSVERISLELPGNDPANWAASSLTSAAYQRLVGEGGQGQGLGFKFIISIDGPGEALVDNVILEDVSSPGTNLITNGTFDAGIDGWVVKGLATGSSFAPGEGVGGTGGLRVTSSDFCPGGECGEANGVSQSVPGVVSGGRYRVTVDFRYVKGSPRFRAGLFRGAAVIAQDFPTPARPNSTASPRLPPFVMGVGRDPMEPRSTDPVWLTALVISSAPPTVTLVTQVGDETTRLAMSDDGLHHDGLAGDGVYGVDVPPYPHDTQVRFRIEAVSGDGFGDIPRARYPGVPLQEEYLGYYVNDLQPTSTLPVYQILLPGVDPTQPQDVNKFLNCFELKDAAFATKGDLYPSVGLRFRGNTACFIQKRNFKIVFNRVAPFHGLRKMNLNGLWTDKAILREPMAWEFLREIGAPYMETHFVRVHLNGAYHGLFLYVEHPDSRFLERMGLATNGNLYKAKQPIVADPEQGPIGVPKADGPAAYKSMWELETNENGDFSDITEFVDAMHADGTSAAGPSVGFWSARSYEQMIIDYQIGQVILNNIDSFAKNHFLYHDLDRDRWGFIAWDLDLTFGKFFSLQAVKFPDRPVGTLNDEMLSDVGGDLNPWFGATVKGNFLYNYLVDFFLRAGGGYYQRAYLVQLWDVLQEKYRNEVYDPRLDALAKDIEKEEADDHARWGRYVSNVAGYPDDMLSNIEIMKRQIFLHRQFLIDYIKTWHGTIPDSPRVKITEILYHPEGGNDDLEFLELRNSSGRALDLSGWSIDGIAYSFPQGSSVPAGATFVVARSPAAFLARYPDRKVDALFGPYTGKLANEGEVLRLRDAGQPLEGGKGLDYPATIDFVQYDSKKPWPQVLPGYSIELRDPGADTDNDVPENWVASAQPGGTPGEAAPLLLRGSADGDDVVNLTDAIYLLNYLFRGGESPPCLDAADANDDGQLNITDGIYLLGFLFQGTAAPPPPFPERGVDPTPDGLGCSF